MKTDIFYDTAIGIRLFNNVGQMYFKIHGVYPTTNDKLPEYITELGYPCTVANIKPPVASRERIGITLDEEIATALILVYG